MGFRKGKNISLKYARDGSSTSSNPGTKIPDDGPDFNGTMHKNSSKRKIETNVHVESSNSINVAFKRNMNEKSVRRELFILEYQDGFDNKSLKGKMAGAINQSNNCIKSLFYEKGVAGELPSSWEEFKEVIVSHCTGQDLDSVHKYRDEIWSDYCKRLRNYKLYKNVNENMIYEKLRSEFAPRNLQMLFYLVDVSLDAAINRIVEMQKFTKNLNINIIKKGFQFKKKSHDIEMKMQNSTH
jgi:hypothetical protein